MSGQQQLVARMSWIACRGPDAGLAADLAYSALSPPGDVSQKEVKMS
jgi:hypothetical protein